LRQLYAEGKTLFDQQHITREEAKRLDRVLQTLINLNAERLKMQKELRRLDQINFSRIGEGAEADPESKRQHFIQNQYRLWETRVEEIRPNLERQLSDIR
jgi:hypothetical protein